MSKKQIFFSLISLFIFACQEENVKTTFLKREDKDSSISVKSKPISKSAESAYYNYEKVQISSPFKGVKLLNFSSTIFQDSVVLYVPQGLITDTKCILRIKDKNGMVLYEHIFPTLDLIYGYSISKVVIKSDKEMGKHVLNSAQNLLDECEINVNKLPSDSYLKQVSKKDFTDYTTFAEIKRSNRILFHYRLKEEEHYYLGYSEKEKKIVSVIDCC